MKTNETKWIAKVVNRITDETVYTSRPKTTWEEAQRAAEKAGKRIYGKSDVWKVEVI